MTGKALRILIGCVVLMAAFGAGLWAGHGAPWPPALWRQSPPVILKEVQALSELVTVKYVMEKVVTHEIEKTFGKDKILLVAHGVVKAGIDLRKLAPEDLRVSGKAVSFHLPRSQVTDSYLDEKQTFVYDRRTGMFASPDKDLESEARRAGLTAMLTAAHAKGIHQDADDRARMLITQVFRSMGFETVEFH
jgi:hypothetical protein